MAKVFESAGIPTVVLTPLVDLAMQFGAYRIVRGLTVTSPLGDPEVSAEKEKTGRQALVVKALTALTKHITVPMSY
ncbi:hypothetical protein DCMF_22815 [Candidatus Formimonas warabiya]|uniref:Uncharacterized protein n=3 Tax=Formimonas warabiya TaxID=1761012 RepID=A0A3G1KXM0_FORW1|nr:hypothetical protein DCMF_22815 [Candidatus Formimonas warabiya]